MYYGFDIGGTKIALGVFDSGRQLQWEKRVPTPRDSYDAFLDAVCELVAEADQRFGCKGSVGIGIPGMPETTPLIKAALNLRVGAGFDVYLALTVNRFLFSCHNNRPPMI